MAVASMILGFLAWLAPAAIAAIALGHRSRSQIQKSHGQKKGAGMALTGLILGYTFLSLRLAIIAAIAIPNLLHARISANERETIKNLRLINNAAQTYLKEFGQLPISLSVMGPAIRNPSEKAANLIDAELATGSEAGYKLTYEAVDSNGDGKLDAYTLHADPITPGTTGERFFFVDSSGVIRERSGGRADAESPPIT